MVVYTFYRIPEANYIGSTYDFPQRKRNHKSCLNKCKYKLYNKLRGLGITEIQYEILWELDTNIHLKIERMFIEKYNSIQNGGNTILPYLYPEETDGNGLMICIHDRQPYKCIECGGSSICIHDKLKYYCKECGGSAFCEHDIKKHRCKECGGGAVCVHDKRKENCKICSPEICISCNKLYSKGSIKQHSKRCKK